MKKAILRYRLLQLSPLIIAALIAALWFSFPIEARHRSLDPVWTIVSHPDGVDAIDMSGVQVSVMESLLRQKRGLEPYEDVFGSSGVRALDGAAARTAGALFRAEPEVCDENGVPRLLTADEQSTLFSDLEQFEELYDASVMVYVISSDPEPPVALSSIGEESVLTTAELAAVRGEGSVASLRREVLERPTGPLWVDLQMLNGGQADIRGDRFIGWSTLLLDGRLWEAYTVAAADSFGDVLTGGTWESLSDTDLMRSAENIARSSDGAVLVVGPVDAGRHVVRPANARVDETELWDLATRTSAHQALWQPVPLRGEERKIAGGARLMELAFAGSGVTPRVALVALYDNAPQARKLWSALGRSPLTVVRVWVGTYLSVLMVTLGIALIASFAASPLAFRAERIYREEREALRERARVQREAELRVVSKLGELSTRVEAVRDHASVATSTSVSGVAEDIDSTVAELRRILGDVAREESHDE
ncbi:MAG: hypothetical protein JXP72_03695 [Coriobacteriia bacterium]|nr:hypothetical protein [Coriobacteriia bacterium]